MEYMDEFFFNHYIGTKYIQSNKVINLYSLCKLHISTSGILSVSRISRKKIYIPVILKI